MTAVEMDGIKLAQKLRAGFARRAAALLPPPKMVMVLVGADAASQSYLTRKAQDAAEIGLIAEQLTLPADISRAGLLAEVARLNEDPAVDGFFVQFPLPPGHDPAEVSAAILPDKDIDGLGPVSLGRLVAGLAGLRPTTPAGIMALLAEYQIPLAGKRALIIGRGALVGRPLSLMLSAKGSDAVVTTAHRSTLDLAALCQSADLIVSAAGAPDLVRPEMIRPGATVIGTGISYDAAGQMRSDIALGAEAVAGHLSAHPSSVGALTRAMLLGNLLAAAEAKRAG